MSAALPVLSGHQVVAALQRAGFARVSQRGSHVKLRRQDATGRRTVIVPLHNELAPGTVRSILDQAGLTADELRALL